MLNWLTSLRLSPNHAVRMLSTKAWSTSFKSALVRYLGLQAGWRDLPLQARAYLLFTWATSSILVLWAVRELTWSRQPLGMVVLLAVLLWSADLFPIELQLDDAEVTLAVSAGIAAVMLVPPSSIPLVAFVGTGLAELRFTRPWYKKAFNISQRVVILTSLALVFQFLAGDSPLILLDSIRTVAAIVVVWVAHYVLNVSMVTIAIALSLGLSPFLVWRASYRDVVYHQVFAAPLGTLLALLIQQQPLALVLILPPMYLMYRALELTADLQCRTMDALMAFASSIDARDPSTYQHSQRVGELARAIARQMALPPDEVETIHLSARVHDLGKVGIPDAILFNPGELSDDEYDMIKEHPVISAKIVETFPLFDVGHDIIKCHHERYDGEGYPERLAAEDIPLGARILAVADAYDAMISDRPYREGLPHKVAVQRIIEEKATQFDPTVVDAFLEVVGVASQSLTIEGEDAAGLAIHTWSPEVSANGPPLRMSTGIPVGLIVPATQERRE